MQENLQELIRLVQENPELPVICEVDGEICCGDEYYLGEFGRCFVGEYAVYAGREGVKIMQNKQNDMVNHPSHYTQGGVECIDALEAATTGLTGIEAVCTANAIKYLWRWKFKGGKQDLEKARWYIDRMISKLELPTIPSKEEEK